MSFQSLYEDGKVSTPELTTLRSKEEMSQVSVAAYPTKASARTYIMLNKAIAKAASIRPNSRVSLLVGEGRDKGKVRIVANRNGAVKLNGLSVRTSHLLEEATEVRDARVTSFAKGAITVAI